MKSRLLGVAPWRWPWILVLLGVSGLAGAGPVALEDQVIPVQENVSVWTSAGYEAGPIPDWFVHHRLTLGLPSGLQLVLGGVWGGFPQQSQVRVDSIEEAIRWQPFADKDWGAQIEAGGFFVSGDPIYVPYSGKAPSVSHLVSPRAWGGHGIDGGVRGWFDSAGWGVQANLRVGYVWDRTAPWFGWSDGQRWEAGLAPWYQLLPSLTLLVEQRGTLWPGRGYSYEVLPELTWGPFPDWQFSAGVGVPVVGVSIWRGLVGVHWAIPVKVATAVQAVSGSIPSVNWDFQVIPEGQNLRIRIYFTFLGDRSDLFEPQNVQFGPQNRKLMQKLLDYIAQYPTARLQVEGHTNRANLTKSYEEEQRTEMLPLARSRCESVSKALGALGIEKKRMINVPVGGAKPLAKFDDPENSWKNRRVEIVILRE